MAYRTRKGEKMKLPCNCPEMTEEDFQALDLQELHLNGRSFYEARVPMLTHFPVAPEMRIDKVLAEINRKGLTVCRPLRILFADGLFIGRVMVEVENSGKANDKVITYGDTRLVGKTFDGPRYLVPKALKEFDRELLRQGVISTDYYFWYLSCQGCGKANKSKTVIYAKIK